MIRKITVYGNDLKKDPIKITPDNGCVSYIAAGADRSYVLKWLEDDEWLTKDVQGTRYYYKRIQSCKKCGKKFDLMKYGHPGGSIDKTICWDCEPPYYGHCQSVSRRDVDWDALDAMEDRCLGSFSD